MSVQMWVTVIGLLLNLCGLAYTVNKVSFLAGRLTEKVDNHDERLIRVEDWKETFLQSR